MKKRFDVLDGLRGLAGLAVVLFHFSESYCWCPGKFPQVIGHGYLAVEFFLIMTGFVLGYAYDERWAKGLSVRDFFVRRLVRLHPLVVFGTLLGFVVCLFGQALLPAQFTRHFYMEGVPAWKMAGFAVLAMLMVPIGGHGPMNPFNGCSWTLVYEYAANLVYGLFLRRVGLRILSALTAAAGAYYFTRICSHWSLVGGFTTEFQDTLNGIARTTFPFLLGLLLSRLGWKIRLRGALPVSAVLFLAVLFVPTSYKFGTSFGMPWLNAVVEGGAVAVVFPLLLLIGAGSDVPARAAGACRYLGELSYPLYMTHYPFMTLQMGFAYLYWNRFSVPVLVFFSFVQFILSALFAHWVMRHVDVPSQRLVLPLVTGRNAK